MSFSTRAIVLLLSVTLSASALILPNHSARDISSPTAENATTNTSTAASTGFFPGEHVGDATFYSTGLGACGITTTDADLTVAISHLLYDSYPGYNGVNTNPACNTKIMATYQGKSVTATVTDSCTGCTETDLDFSPGAFTQLADLSAGRITGVAWTWDD